MLSSRTYMDPSFAAFWRERALRDPRQVGIKQVAEISTPSYIAWRVGFGILGHFDTFPAKYEKADRF
jgi:hypothetical protein